MFRIKNKKGNKKYTILIILIVVVGLFGMGYIVARRVGGGLGEGQPAGRHRAGKRHGHRRTVVRHGVHRLRPGRHGAHVRDGGAHGHR